MEVTHLCHEGTSNVAPSSIFGRTLDATSSMFEELLLRLWRHSAPGIRESAQVTVEDLIHIGAQLTLPSRASEHSAAGSTTVHAALDARKQSVILRLRDRLRRHGLCSDVGFAQPRQPKSSPQETVGAVENF